MPTKDQVLGALERLHDYEAVARALSVPPGQAYLIATGLPADGGDSFAPCDIERPGVLEGSTQHLVYGGSEPERPSTKGHESVHAWVGRRVAADGPMRRAAETEATARGAVTAEADIHSVLTQDHDQVMGMLKRLKAISGVTGGGSPLSQSRRKAMVEQIAAALSKHEAAEEECLWPVVRSVLEKGDAVVEVALSEEQESKDIRAKLGKAPPNEERFDELAEQLDTATRKHVAFEDRLLLALRGTMSMEDRRALGRRFREAAGKPPPAAQGAASQEVPEADGNPTRED